MSETLPGSSTTYISGGRTLEASLYSTSTGNSKVEIGTPFPADISSEALVESPVITPEAPTVSSTPETPTVTPEAEAKAETVEDVGEAAVEATIAEPEVIVEAEPFKLGDEVQVFIDKSPSEEGSQSELSTGWVIKEIRSDGTDSKGQPTKVALLSKGGIPYGRPVSFDKLANWQKAEAPPTTTVEVKPPEVEATPEDWDRIQAEGTEYFENFDISNIAELRARLAEVAQNTKAEMKAQLTELGLDGDDLAGAAVEQVKVAVEKAVADMTIELVNNAVPSPQPENNGWRARRRVDKARQKMTALLSMGQADYDKLEQDWKLYNKDKDHGQALKEDKSFKFSEKKRAVSAEMAKLDGEYGGVLDVVGNLPLDKAEGGPTDNAIKSYMDRQARIESGDPKFADQVQELSIKKALAEIQDHLRAQYKKEGLKDAQIESRIKESNEALKTWLQNTGPEDKPLDDLEAYDRQKNLEQMIAAKRQKAARFMGSSLVARAVKGVVGMERGPSQREVGIGEALAHSVDHDGSRAKAGAEALRKSGGESGFIGRMMAQLEMARTLARNEGLMRASLLYGNAAINIIGDGGATAWEQIPEEKKKEARKKLMLGMAAAAKSIMAMKAKKAAEKAAATTGTEAKHYG